MKSKLCLVAAAAMMVAGCGGGSESDMAASPDAQPVAQALQLSRSSVASADLLFDPAAAAPVSTVTATSSLTGAGSSHVAMGPHGKGLMFYVREAPYGDGVFLPTLFSRSIDADGQLGAERLLSSAPAKDLRVKFTPNGKYAAIVWSQYASGTSGPSRIMLAGYYSNVDMFTGPEGYPQAGVEMERPDVAFSADSQWGYVAWTERQQGQNGAADTFRTKAAALDLCCGVGWSSDFQTVRALGADQRDRNARVAVLPDGTAILVARQQALPGTGQRLAFYRAGPNKPWTAGNQTPVELSYYLQHMPAGSVLDFDLASNAAGQVTVVWRHAFPGPNGRTAVFSTRLLPTGAWSDPLLVDVGAPSAAADPSVGMDSTDPRVVVDTDGNALFAWRQQDALGGSVSSVYAARLNAVSGQFEARPLALESRSQMTIGAPVLTLNADGRGVVSWVQDASDGDPFSFSLFARRIEGGGKTFGAAALVEDDTRHVIDISPGVALAADGRVLALWRQGGRVMFNRSQ